MMMESVFLRYSHCPFSSSTTTTSSSPSCGRIHRWQSAMSPVSACAGSVEGSRRFSRLRCHAFAVADGSGTAVASFAAAVFDRYISAPDANSPSTSGRSETTTARGRILRRRLRRPYVSIRISERIAQLRYTDEHQRRRAECCRRDALFGRHHRSAAVAPASTGAAVASGSAVGSAVGSA